MCARTHTHTHTHLHSHTQVPEAPSEVQEIFDTMQTRIALRGGHGTAKDYITKVLGGVVYHFTLNYMGGHTIDHNDSIITDGPGQWIFNLSLQGDGLVYFVDDEKRTPDGVKLDMHAVWQVPAHLQTPTHPYTYTQIYMHTHIHTYIHTHRYNTLSHTHTHTHTHTFFHRKPVTASASVEMPASSRNMVS